MQTIKEKPLFEQINQRIAELTILQNKKLKPTPAKEKSKQKTIEQWNFNIPIQIIPQNQKYFETSIDQTEEQDITFNQLLDRFVQSILTENYQKPLMNKLFYRAENQQLKNLWNSEYTNKLSFAIHLLTLSCQKLTQQAKSTKLQSKLKNTEQNQENQNLNAQNMQIEHSEEQNGTKNKKKRKIKKENKKHEPSTQKKKKIQIESENNDEPEENTKKINQKSHFSEILIQQNYLKSELKNMIADLNAQIDRVEKLYLEEMEKYQILPYEEAEAKIHNTFKAKTNSQTQNPRAQYQNVNVFQDAISKFSPINTENVFPLSNIYSQKHQSLHEMNFPNQFFSFPRMNPQMNPMNMPFIPINPSMTQMNQHMGNFGHQSMLNPPMFVNGNFQNNSFYDPTMIMMNMNNFGQNLHHQQTVTRNQGNSSSGKKVIVIENLDENQE